MSRERNSDWRREMGIVLLFLDGQRHPYKQIPRFEADALVKAGTHLYHPSDETQLQEIPAAIRMKASARGAIRGASCNYSGAEKHRYEVAMAEAGWPGRPVLDEDGNLLELYDELGRAVLLPQLSPMQVLAFDSRQQAMLAACIAEGKPTGSSPVAPRKQAQA